MDRNKGTQGEEKNEKFAPARRALGSENEAGPGPAAWCCPSPPLCGQFANVLAAAPGFHRIIQLSGDGK